ASPATAISFWALRFTVHASRTTFHWLQRPLYRVQFMEDGGHTLLDLPAILECPADQLFRGLLLHAGRIVLQRILQLSYIHHKGPERLTGGLGNLAYSLEVLFQLRPKPLGSISRLRVFDLRQVLLPLLEIRRPSRPHRLRPLAQLER